MLGEGGINNKKTIVYSFPDYGNYRHACYFRYIRVRRWDHVIGDYSIPSIVLCENGTDIPIMYTGLEVYVFDASKDFFQAWETLKQKAVAVIHLLNYLLHKTRINSISEVTVDVVREFKEYMKTIHVEPDDNLGGLIKGNQSKETYQDTTWEKYTFHAIIFLNRFHKANKDDHKFLYDSDELVSSRIVYNKKTGLKLRFVQNEELFIKKPAKKTTKARVIAYSHLDILLAEARIHDPFLRLAIAFGAYAGLREGEVVNTCIGKVNFSFGIDSEDVKKITIDISEEAPFFKNWAGRTSPGKIKKKRPDQEVYLKFVGQFKTIYDEHIAMMRAKGYDTSPGAPLFVNEWGNPMTEFTYRNRIESLFKNHFMNYLRKWRDKNLLVVASDMAFLCRYEAAYPGAHMFRHWFSMYLIVKENLPHSLVMKLRGDSDLNSVEDYISVNSDVLQAFEESSQGFQGEILEGLNLVH